MIQQPNITVPIGKLLLKNPVMSASGTFGYGEEFADFVNPSLLGALIVKGVSLEPRLGNPPPRIIEVCGGMLNAIGLENVGLQAFLRDKLPPLRKYDTKIIVNIFGESVEEYAALAASLDKAQGIHALEVNISCPNVQAGGVHFGTDPQLAYQVISSVKTETSLPVIVKLTPNVTDITTIAKAVEAAGADAISLINTLTGLSIDVTRRKPHLANITGGLSGPAIKPIALRMLWQVRNCVSLPLIGVGGIMNANDALEFIIAGASAVQIGTANFVDPRAMLSILEGIEEYLKTHHFSNIHQLIGSLDQETPGHQEEG